MSSKRLFNDGWEFSKQPIGSTLDDVNRGELTFQPVDLPHDWLIYNTLDLYEDSVGWYRKKFNVNKQSKEHIALRFEGVYMDSTVYINGKAVDEWKYGYSTFEFDTTDNLVDGENEVIVKVVHQGPNSRWYSGAGIYRDVWLKTYNDTHIASDGVYIATRKDKDGWQVEVDTELENYQNAKLTHTILYNNQIVTSSIAKVNSGVNSQTLSVEKPNLWDLDTPNLYQLKSELLLNGTVIDTEVNDFGFRTTQFDPEKGFLLNGKHIKMNGVCEHHDLGSLGSAFHKAAMRRKIAILKEMGVNAIRTSHNMPAVGLVELADEMGVMLISEAFDMWERPKTKYDYARFFNDWAEKDVASWVRRDRNHPSVIMWSIGNEIYDTHAGERGQEITRMLMDYVLEHDPKKNATITIGSNYMPWENAQKCADIVKVAGYNYAEKYYEEHHKAHPDWVIYGSETASVVQSRGIYHFPYEKSLLSDDDEQCSSLGNSTTSWGAKSTEACIIADRDTKFSLGQFMWTGFDYIGEPTPYHTKNSYFGQIDTAGFKKDSFFVFQAEWTDCKKNPMIHILPYWDFNPGQMIDVRVCTNAPRMELQFNGKVVGTYDVDHVNGTQLLGWWKIPYAPGELKAIAYGEDGKVVATEVKRSFGDAKTIALSPDKQELKADGQDLVFVEITMQDADGNPVENANNRVNITVEGAGRLVGLDNGDSTDYDQYKGTSRRLFSGKLLAVIAANTTPGEIRMNVSSVGLESKEIVLHAIPAEGVVGVSAIMQNVPMPSIMGAEAQDIPVRKIELISMEGNTFSEGLREMKVKAVLYPENASYTDLEWSVVNDAGIASNIAFVSADGNEATVKALGDGSFRLRCMTKNGTDKIKLISQLEFHAAGLGTAYKNPYEFISGGLYELSNGDVGNGNERGFATSRDGVTQVGFKDIDFGDFGSDEITIPIFALSSDEYYLQIWEGMPDEEGSSLLADVIYQKESKWNVYQEETYKLNRRLKGITSICFVLKYQKVHIKGFTFTKLKKAYEQLNATENDHIYGDTFKLTDTAVEGIGNNVSLVYEDMDFGELGTDKLIICGKSPIEKNTIHIRFSGETGDSNQIVEFAYTDDYVQKEFHIDQIRGKQNVTFVFLPGCNFDFKWFRFGERN
ncbi:MAG TPA: glycoside hydrolase family 2 TIM barrel-domain containing protein [Mobilitalea sp.]|nr:glycoside hydrolase family 2 TIM barrel-domain containing protein [Mobilitalea sp.]